MAKVDMTSPRTRRTREHVIAAMSVIHVQKTFIDYGYTTDRESEDYGYDLVAKTYDEDGYREEGDIRIQVKATDRLHQLVHKDFISLKIEVKHHNLWIKESMPVFLILYDAKEKKAYWLYVQVYFAEDPARRPKAGAKTLTVHIPLANDFSEDTVDYMRARKAAILAGSGKALHHG